ncbi:MAG: endolytic transglycosylase MltG [Candidatus Shapirobacteria bacterium]|nr:endolytic transglycosylase MltG [Candidatus Shapirobacteria bacterium]
MKKFPLVLFIISLVIGIGIYSFVNSNITPVSLDTKNKIFIVNEGEGIQTISQNLFQDGFIKNEHAFLIYSIITRQNNKLQSGTFRLSASLSVPEIIKKLTSGGISDYWLKIIDGSRLEEIARLFPSGLSFNSQEFLTKYKLKEGYFFPDSYLIPSYFNLDQTVEVINKNFVEKFAKAKENSTSNLIDEDIVILASLLEREGRSLESKQMIAGIIINRLNLGKPLQIDATAQYARDNLSKNITTYWQPVSKQDLQIDSSYNTYKNQGLPPRPICSPGYNSLFAAFHPTDSDYIYYITGNDGKMYYAVTFEEHNSNIAKYLK